MAMVQQANDHDVVQRIHTARTKHHHRDAAEAFEKQASACVAACFDRLVPNVEEACRQLQQPVYQQARLWDLYCCDSISCGVYIGESGQSPNVDLIINECQNIGFFTIGDPGPPSSNYCALSSPDTVTTSSPPHTITRTPSTIPGPRTGAITGTLDTSMLFGTPSISASSVRNTSSPVLTSATSTRLTTGAKVAISIFSIIAGVAIIAILLFLIRQRKRRSRSSSPQPPQSPYVNRSYPIPSNGSGTRLITPPPTASSRSVSLTPPAKLSERKFLDPARRTGTPRPPTSPNVANLTSPSWPIDGSAQSGPISRLKAGNMADNDRFPTARAAAAPPSSVYSVSSELSGPTATVHGNKVSSVHSSSASVTGHNMPPPPSVTKFPRKPEAPLSSSEYAAPAAPAPTRALPAPPHNHPNSPTFSVSSTSPRSLKFPTRALTRGDSPVVHSPQENILRPSALISTKELRDLTESYARDTRESWGSWGGVGGGGPGVASAGRKRRSAERKAEAKPGVALQELDMEKLSGRY